MILNFHTTESCSPPKPGHGVNDAILYTANYCGADTILALGGVQGIAAMAFGLFTGKPADILLLGLITEK